MRKLVDAGAEAVGVRAIIAGDHMKAEGSRVIVDTCLQHRAVLHNLLGTEPKLGLHQGSFRGNQA